MNRNDTPRTPEYRAEQDQLAQSLNVGDRVADATGLPYEVLETDCLGYACRLAAVNEDGTLDMTDVTSWEWAEIHWGPMQLPAHS